MKLSVKTTVAPTRGKTFSKRVVKVWSSLPSSVSRPW